MNTPFSKSLQTQSLVYVSAAEVEKEIGDMNCNKSTDANI